MWADVRRFIEDPGEVLERVRKQLGSDNGAGEKLEARREELTKRLVAKQAEKDRYVRAYAQEHISEEELDVYIADLKNQTDNLRLLLRSVDADLAHRRERMELTETTRAWPRWKRTRRTPSAYAGSSSGSSSPGLRPGSSTKTAAPRSASPTASVPRPVKAAFRRKGAPRLWVA